MEKLGKLEEVKLRDIWPHEQHDFSKWLAKDENIKALGEIVNLSITDVEREKFVGSYRCDIVGKDEITDKVVLIENQLEPTNHDHLGKIVTYASGLNASVVIWIVENAREEHASAIEWLNKHTSEDLSFFLIEIHVCKIGDSAPAPYFKIIEKPNDFSKTAKAVPKTQEYWIDFWNKFNEAIDKHGKPFPKHKAHNHWYNVSIGTSQCRISIDLINKEHRIRVGLWIPDNTELFELLHDNKADIETACGPLIWDKKESAKATSIYTYIDGLDFDNQKNYDELMDKIIEIVVTMRDTFTEYF